MRILSLNALDGELPDKLKDFLVSEQETTDVFCFQETLGTAIETLFSELFPETLYSLVWTEKTTSQNGQYNLCTVIKKPFAILGSQTLLDLDDESVGQSLATTIALPEGRAMAIVNVHGVPFPGDKLDNAGRLRQSDTILGWLAKHSDMPAVICGDFNLLPEADSVKKFALAGYQDLIAAYHIPTTRNELAWKHWPDNIQLYADYTFVSPELHVSDFSVPNIEVSDHLPMITTLR